MTAAKKTTAASIADAIAAARADLDQLRDRITDLLAERREVSNAPCELAEAERRVAAIIDQARVGTLFNRPLLFAPDGGQLGDHFVDSLRRDPLEALAVVCPEGLAAALLSHRSGGGLSPDARAARLAKIERDLQAAQVAEEIACREVEGATGATVPRRLDANPAALLAPTEELEGEAWWQTTDNSASTSRPICGRAAD